MEKQPFLEHEAVQIDPEHEHRVAIHNRPRTEHLLRPVHLQLRTNLPVQILRMLQQQRRTATEPLLRPDDR